MAGPEESERRPDGTPTKTGTSGRNWKLFLLATLLLVGVAVGRKWRAQSAAGPDEPSAASVVGASSPRPPAPEVELALAARRKTAIHVSGPPNRLAALPEPTNSVQLCAEPGALPGNPDDPIHEPPFFNGLLANDFSPEEDASLWPATDLPPSDPAPDRRHAYDPWDYGITGRVQVAGLPSFPFSVVKIGAWNELGEGVSDLLDSDGSFQLFELGPGEWELTLELPGVGFVERSVVLTSFAPVHDLIVEFPKPASIDVELRWSGDAKLAAGVRGNIQVVGHRMQPTGPKGSRAQLGELCFFEFRASKLAREGLIRTAILPGPERPAYLSLFHDGLFVEGRKLADPESLVSWQLSPDTWPAKRGSIQVRVRDAHTLAPLEAWVTPVGVGAYEVADSPAGTTRLDALPPGWRELSISHVGYEALREWFFVPPGGIADPEIMLQPGITLRGMVLDPDGDAIERSVIAWRVDPATKAIESAMYSSSPARDGGFMFAGLRPGRYYLRTRGPDEGSGDLKLTSAFVEVDANDWLTELSLVLQPVGRIVLDQIEEGRGPLSYRLEDTEGRWVRSGVLLTTASRRLEVARGSYRLIVSEGERVLESWQGAVGQLPVLRRF